MLQSLIPANRIKSISQGGLAVLDQGIFAGTNLLINILLARWLVPEEYGLFALIYAVIIFVAGLHKALFIEPMLVLGASKYQKFFRAFLGILIRTHALLFIGLSLIIALIAFLIGALGSMSFQSIALTVAIILPIYLLLLLVRQSFYVVARPYWAAAGSALHLLITISLISIFQSRGELSLEITFLSIGAGALVVSLVLLALSRPVFTRVPGLPSIYSILKDCWDYGRWALGVATLVWFINNFYYFILPWFATLVEVAAFKAILNIFNPFQHLMIGLSSFFLPIFSKQYWDLGKGRIKQLLARTTAILLPASLLYSAAILVFGKWLINILYAGKYDSEISLLWYLVLLPPAWVLAFLLVTSLRAMNLPQKVFFSHTVSAAGSLLLGGLLTFVYGLRGAFVSWTINLVLIAVIAGYLYSREPAFPAETKAEGF